MTSKWINKNLFESYVTEKQNEVNEKPNFINRSDMVWPSPKAGTSEKAKVYEGRFLQDPKGKFTKKYFYHMWQSGTKWIFFACPKTNGMEEFCPICSVVSTLYTGTAEDKKLAFKMKRKDRHIGNFYVVDDPRDKEQEDETKKVNGKVKLYEFPSKLESKVKNEVLDKKEGLGLAIFDPGADGHNFIIKIKSTKPDAKGNSYPDYADSIFSRKPSPLAPTEKGIKDIMDATMSIDDYFDSLMMSEENTIKMLKNEMLWDIVETEWNKHKGAPMAEVKTEAKVETKVVKEEDVPDFKEPEEEGDKEGLTDEDLMKELRNMK